MADNTPKTALVGICFTIKKNVCNYDISQHLILAQTLVNKALGEKDWETTYLNKLQQVFIAKQKKPSNDNGDKDFEYKIWKLAQKITRADTAQILEEEACPIFQYFTIDGAPNPCNPDISLPTDWHLTAIKAYDAWKLASAPSGKNEGEGVRIGHIDSGYSTHYELFDNDKFLYNLGSRNVTFGARNWDPIFNPEESYTYSSDAGGHGTSTSSLIIGGNAKESIIKGVASKAELIPFCNANFVIISPEKLIAAIDKAIHYNCHVLSMSLGWHNFDYATQLVEQKLREAVFLHGIIPVAAAAQPNSVFELLGTFSYPGRSPYVVACCAHYADGRPWEYNVKGNHVKVCAPGVSVYKADYHFEKNPTGLHGISQGCGTSYSTAITAGVVANWLSFCGRDRLIKKYGTNLLYPFLYDFYQICHKKDGTVNDDWKPYANQGYGYGRMNMHQLLKNREDVSKWPDLATINAFAKKHLEFNPITDFLEEMARHLNIPFAALTGVISILFLIPIAREITMAVLALVSILFKLITTHEVIKSAFLLMSHEKNLEKQKQLRLQFIDLLKEKKAPQQLIDKLTETSNA